MRKSPSPLMQGGFVISYKKLKSLLLTIIVSVGFLRATQAQDVVVLDSKIPLDFTGCSQIAKNKSIYSYDKACVEKYYDNHQMTLTSFPDWQQSIKKPVQDRLIVATEEMLQYLRLDNLLWDFPYENVQAATDTQLMAGARKALAELPPQMNQYIDQHFYGFMIVSGVGWTGFASSIRAVPNNSLKSGAVIIINADNIKNKTLNEWLAFREKTTFDFFQDDGTSTAYDIAMNYTKPGSGSSLEENLRHFLIHETAHLIVNADPSIHPDFKYRSKPVPFSEFQKWQEPGEPLSDSFPFLTYSWLFDDSGKTDAGEAAYLLSRQVPSYVEPVLKAKKIKFYSTDTKSKFTLDEAVQIYKGLNGTCFPSLYAMVDYSEDFAETVTHYFMSEVEKYNYEVVLTEKSTSGAKPQILAKFQDKLWKKPACKEKLEFMKDLFK